MEVVVLLQRAEAIEGEADAAVDGAAGADEANLDVGDGQDEDGAAEVELVKILRDDVVVADAAGARLAVDFDVHRAAVDQSIARLAVADDGGDAEPGENGNLIAEIDGEGAAVIDKPVGRIGRVHVLVIQMFRAADQAVDVESADGERATDAEAGIFGAEACLANCKGNGRMFAVVREVKELGVGRESEGGEKSREKDKFFGHDV